MTSKSMTKQQQPLPVLPQDWHPEPYQLAGVKFLLENPEGALFLQPGLRKTSITLAAIKILLKEKKIHRVLVVAPPRVCRSVWPREVQKWKDFNMMKVQVLHGLKKEEAIQEEADIYCTTFYMLEWLFGITKQKQVKVGPKWINFDPALLPDYGKFNSFMFKGKKVVVKSDVQLDMVSAEVLKRKDAEEIASLAASAVALKAYKTRHIYAYDLAKFEKLGIDVLVIDEISKFKNTTTERFEALKSVLPSFGRRWGLTGSPIANGLMNLFGIMYVINLGKSLGQYISHYRRTFFYPTGYGGYTWKPQEDAKERIYARIAPYVFRLDSKNLIKLPKIITNPIKVQLPPDARKAYDEIEEEFITELENRGSTSIIVAVNGGAAAQKCRQIANGGLYLPQKIDKKGLKDGKREWIDLHTAKVEAVEDLLDEIGGEPCMVTYDFAHDLARLKAHFGNDVPHIGGGVSAKESDAILEQWNANELPIMFVHFQAMAHGLNAQEGSAHHIIVHSLTADYELFDQLIRRLVRSGNKADKVFVHFIIAEDTVDEAFMLILNKKEDEQTDLNEAMAVYTMRRYGRDIRKSSVSTAKRLKK